MSTQAPTSDPKARIVTEGVPEASDKAKHDSHARAADGYISSVDPRYRLGPKKPTRTQRVRAGLGPRGQDFQDAEVPIWEQQPNETSYWYERFLIYLKLGVTRSVRKTRSLCTNRDTGKPLYNNDQSIPPQFLEYSTLWRWKERADAWDRWQADLERTSWEQERMQSRRARIQTATKLSDILNDTLERIDPDMIANNLSLVDAATVLKMVSHELRLDYNDLPDTRVKVESKVESEVTINVQGAREQLLDRLNRIASRKGVRPPTIQELEPEALAIEGEVRELN